MSNTLALPPGAGVLFNINTAVILSLLSWSDLTLKSVTILTRRQQELKLPRLPPRLPQITKIIQRPILLRTSQSNT